MNPLAAAAFTSFDATNTTGDGTEDLALTCPRLGQMSTIDSPENSEPPSNMFRDPAPWNPHNSTISHVSLHTLQAPEGALTRHGPRHGISSIYLNYYPYMYLHSRSNSLDCGPILDQSLVRSCSWIQIRTTATHPLHPRFIRVGDLQVLSNTYESDVFIRGPQARVCRLVSNHEAACIAR